MIKNVKIIFFYFSNFFAHRLLIFALIAFSAAWAEVNAIDISCSFSTTTVVRMSGKACTFGSSITAVNTEVTSVNGLTTPMDDVKIFYVTSKTFYHFPRNLEKFFPNLESIYVYNSNLRYIDQSFLKPFPKLKEFYVGSNVIRVITDDLFQYNPLITDVYISEGNMYYIGEKLLDRLPNFYYGSFGGCLASKTYSGIDKIAQYRADVKTNCHDVYGKLINWDNNKRLEAVQSTLESAVNNWYKLIKNPNPRTDPAEKYIDLVCNIVGDTCIIENLKVESKNTHFDVSKDLTGAEKSVGDIKKVEIINQQALFLPTGISSHFTAITDLIVTKSGLFQIEQENFNGMSNLVSLNLTQNILHEVPSEVFKNLASLEALDLSHNMIVELEELCFKSLGKLTTLHLNDNKIVTLREGIFNDLVSLKDLDLKNNLVKNIGVKILSPLTKLTKIDFTNNDCINVTHPNSTISEIEGIFLKNCIAPVDLECDFKSYEIPMTETKKAPTYTCVVKDEFKIIYPKNRAFLVNPKHVEGMFDDSVGGIYIKDQAMAYIPIGLSEAFSQVWVISIESSELTSLMSKDFEGYSHLKELKISGNAITKIDSDVFNDIPQLQYLDLSVNEIKSLPAKLFHKTTALKILIISSNPLAVLNYNIFPMIIRLQEFHANDCSLDNIQARILKSVKHAQVINLSGNTCTEVLYEKKKMKFMELFTDVQINCCHEECI